MANLDAGTGTWIVAFKVLLVNFKVINAGGIPVGIACCGSGRSV